MPTSKTPWIKLLFLAPVLLGACAQRPSIAEQFTTILHEEYAAHSAPAPRLLSAADLKGLPEPVRRYVAQSGALGKPLPWNMRVEFDAAMHKKPGAAPMQAHSQQYNFFDAPSRSFYMTARMYGLPVGVLHHYAGSEAAMTVRVAGLFNAVDIRSHDLFKAECVTVLNDLCILAPGRLTDPRLGWKALGHDSAEVSFSNQGLTVKAVLHFNAQGELIDFVSDDRLALQDDGSLKSYRFSTPLKDYQDFGGIRLAGYGDAVYDYPEGKFAYGNFTLKKVEYNVPAFRPLD